MEINDFTILKYITKASENILISYLEENKDIYNVLNKYEDISYLNPLERFFFLFREHEKFISKNEFVLNAFMEHRKSIIVLLYLPFIYGYKDKNASIFDYVEDKDYMGIVREVAHFPEKIFFEYNLSNSESVICLMDLFFYIEINRTIFSIVNRYNESEYGTYSLLDLENAFNDYEFINIYPYLFKGVDELTSNLSKLSDDFNFQNKIVSKFQIINNKFRLINNEIAFRTKCDYTKYYNPYYYRFSVNQFEDENEELLLYLEKYFSPKKLNLVQSKYYFTFFTITTDFKLSGIDFMNDFGNKYYFNQDINVFDNFHGYVQEIELNEQREKDAVIKTEMESLLNNRKYRSLLKLKIDHLKAVKLFHLFIDKQFSGDQAMKEKFRDLFMFIEDESIKEFPKFENLTVKQIKYIMRFFSKYKGNEFDYKVSDLQYLLTHFAGMPEESKNSSIEKAHRQDEFDLNKDAQKQLNSLVR